MSEYLVIVESPAKTKTIKKYLNKKYDVKASMGHIRDLPKSQMGIDIENNFTPKYINIRGKAPLINDLKKAAKKAKRVYLAVDPDREGEAIAWHLAHILGIDLNSKCRVVFNEITKEAIKSAFASPREIDMDLVNAQQGRRILDRLVGYNISPLLWKKVKKGLSAGRVQSVAVRLIIDREEEINNFKPSEYWKIMASFARDRDKFVASFYKIDSKKRELHSQTDVNKVLEKIQGDEFVVKDVVEKERKRNPALAFTTSTLQQEASKKLNFRTRKTMMLAQQLYEGIAIGRSGEIGLITYIRTDSTRVAEIAKQEAYEYIVEHFGATYAKQKKGEDKVKQGLQDAHEAIRPSSILRTPEVVKSYLSRDQYRLYKLIWDRFVASQMAPAIIDTVTADIENNGVEFRATGSKIKFLGFMKVYVEINEEVGEEKENILPNLKKGNLVKLKKIEPTQHFTQPPARYTEARLVKTLEELKIGRPSTYSPTIDTILKRGYVSLDNKRFVPTELGSIVHMLIKDFFPDIINVTFTATLEQKLDLVGVGQLKWLQIIDEFYIDFHTYLQKAENEMEKIEVADEPTGENCEHCNSPMVLKMGRYGKFAACSNFPECRNVKPVLREIGVICPKCNENQVVERKSKKQRLFYGCLAYPKCDYVSWNKPIERNCPTCSEKLIEKKLKKGRQVQCEKCDYKEDVQ